VSVTHGGRAKNFDWEVKERQVFIQSESAMRHSYSFDEILTIISWLHAKFGESWFPLANNVEKMYSGTERAGLGSAIYRLKPGDTFHAQGGSYLGVVLEEVGIFEWNGEKRGICWRIRNRASDVELIEALLTEDSGAANVRMTTIHIVQQPKKPFRLGSDRSRAWRLLQGFDGLSVEAFVAACSAMEEASGVGGDPRGWVNFFTATGRYENRPDNSNAREALAELRD